MGRGLWGKSMRDKQWGYGTGDNKVGGEGMEERKRGRSKGGMRQRSQGEKLMNFK